ncbi:unnamed protein product [Leuciscus chuanchicus]
MLLLIKTYNNVFGVSSEPGLQAGTLTQPLWGHGEYQSHSSGGRRYLEKVLKVADQSDGAPETEGQREGGIEREKEGESCQKKNPTESRLGGPPWGLDGITVTTQ